MVALTALSLGACNVEGPEAGEAKGGAKDTPPATYASPEGAGHITMITKEDTQDLLIDNDMKDCDHVSQSGEEDSGAPGGG